jgi:hypothetical protein
MDMEITFVWSWFSFWVGFASVFVGSIALILALGIANAVKQSGKKREIPAGSLDDLITWRKTK